MDEELTVIPVDLNNRARLGLVTASFRRVTGPVAIGDTVIARDDGEAHDFRAVVRDIENKKIYLELDWEAARIQ